jgi:UDP-2,3-diacylglucosamine hydrolase
MAFRALVRSDAWKEEFLSRPIGAREDIARGLRQQSEAHKMSESSFTDVDSLAAGAMLRQADATTLVHGHTHQPATHTLGSGMQRIVLSDWDLAAQPPRSQVLRLTRGAVSQAKIERISPLSA